MFSSLNCDTANIKRVTGFDSYGNADFSTIDTVKGKLEYKFKRITDSNGENVVSNGSFRCESALNELDMIEVNGQYKEFIAIQPQTDFNGKTVYWIGWF